MQLYEIPCGNLHGGSGSKECKIDNSNRKTLPGSQAATTNGSTTQSQQDRLTPQQQNWGNGIVNPSDIVNPNSRRWSGSSMSNELADDSRNQNGQSLCKQHLYLYIAIKLTIQIQT